MVALAVLTLFSLTLVFQCFRALPMFLEDKVTERTACLKKAGEDLRVEKEYSENILSTMTDSLVVTDSSGKIVTVNRAICRVLEYEKCDLLGQPIDTIFSLKEEIDAGRLDFMETSLAKLIAEKPIVDLNTFFKSKSDKRIPIGLSSSAMRDENGNLTAVVSVAHDLTERIKTQEAITRFERDAATGRLSAMVAHQINNPLAVMNMRIDQLREDMEGNEQAVHSADTIKRQIVRISKTVKSLLGYSREKHAARKKVLVKDILENVISLFEPFLTSKGIQLEVDVPEYVPEIIADSSDIQEIMVNLIENARQAMNFGTIWIRCTVSEKEIEIIVEDDGPGLGDNPLKVFDPYFTTKAEGTGIGLSIAKETCVSQGGDMFAENRGDKPSLGARFRVILARDL